MRFHRAVTEGHLLSPALTAQLSPKASTAPAVAASHLTGFGFGLGFGFEFETDADDVVRCYWKEGVNVELAVHEPLQYLDERTAARRTGPARVSRS